MPLFFTPSLNNAIQVSKQNNLSVLFFPEEEAVLRGFKYCMGLY